MNAESQRQATIATTTQYEAQRIAKNKNELTRYTTIHYECHQFVAAQRCATTVLNMFKTVVALPRSLAISAMQNDFLPNKNELQRTTTTSTIFSTNQRSLWFANKIVTVGLGL